MTAVFHQPAKGTTRERLGLSMSSGARYLPAGQDEFDVGRIVDNANAIDHTKHAEDPRVSGVSRHLGNHPLILNRYWP